MTGVLLDGPTPLLRVPPGEGRATSRTLFLSGDGKRGAPLGDPPPYGRMVRIEGFVLRRGTLEMLVASGPPMPVAAEPVAPQPAEALGRWRVTGEICDGKCAAGAMRPGTGLSHRACAVLCLDGDIPAVFVAASPVTGQAFLLLADREGRAPMPAFRHLVGHRVTLEGEVERRGDLLVFRAEEP
ncbi:hypothetical protein ACE7GA_17870 [Roseomonas sp. CCTCC AB2023176]|uniref:hypothetical protein n=1 Tax=Roseomonas sp. CCTCC AB2023176 TaxID=3342640 RepID=UPI0035D81BAE